ncbi:MAG: DNA polymerase III subunit beta [Candidatus Coatesbacteria bacterium]|nr:MAG: DNA polymerase III subunit beta [Candidatus Coatesbacteria bacterium]RLC44104.1 MAG: DNA polymerase III subunit beta [Candidatus Coatesbacteria bacterium]
MEIICEREKLAEDIGLVQSAVSPRSPMPILSNMLLRAENGMIDLIGTDLDIYLWKCTDGEIVEDGSITVPSRKLSEIVRGFQSSGSINLKTDGLSLKISYEKAEFRLQGISPEEYPVFPKIDGAVDVEIDGSIVKTMMKETVFAVSEDETRYALNGISFQIEGNRLVTVATDGYMLAYKHSDIDETIEGIVDVIIPTRAAQELIKIIEDEEKVKVSFGEKYVLWQMRQGYLASRLVEGKFPNYRSAIPEKFNYKLVLNRAQFLDKVNLVSMIADERTNQIMLEVAPGLITIRAESPEMGEGSDQMDVEYDGEKFTVAYNANLLKEVLKSFSDDLLQYELVDPIRHGKFSPPGADDHFCIIMPMKV